MVAWRFLGIMTRFPHMRQLPSNPSSVSHSLNGFSSLGTSAGHPDCTYVCTLLNSGSLRVSCWILAAVAGSVSILRILKLLISEWGSRGSDVGKGKHESPSAFACTSVGRNLMSSV